MEITGKLLHILPLQTGQGKNGQWKRQDIVLETSDTYPKKICLAAWGDKVDINKFRIGQAVKASFDIESREYNGKWYTDLKVYNLQGVNNDNNSDNSKAEEKPSFTALQDDDLPF